MFNILVAFGYGVLQCRGVIEMTVSGFDVCTTLNQELHHFRMPGIRGQHECCVSSVVFCIIVYAVAVQKQLHQSIISAFCRPQ
jgi:hypothetical protein